MVAKKIRSLSHLFRVTKFIKRHASEEVNCSFRILVCIKKCGQKISILIHTVYCMSRYIVWCDSNLYLPIEIKAFALEAAFLLDCLGSIWNWQFFLCLEQVSLSIPLRVVVYIINASASGSLLTSLINAN